MLWRTPTTIEFNIFLLKFCTRFLFGNAYKIVCGIFFILFTSWVINKSVKRECVETRSFLVFANNSRSKKNKKNPTHSFVGIVKQETRAKFQQKIMNCSVVGARQSSQIFRQNTSFSKTIDPCLNFCMRFCNT